MRRVVLASDVLEGVKVAEEALVACLGDGDGGVERGRRRFGGFEEKGREGRPGGEGRGETRHAGRGRGG